MKKDNAPQIASSIRRASTLTLSRLLIENGNNNPVVEDDYTAATLSAQCGNYTAIDLLAARHVDLNAPDSAGRTGLDLAYHGNWGPTFSALLKGGANPAETTQHGYNMLERIATTGNTTWADRITTYVTGAALDTRDADGNTPLLLALKHARHGVALSYIKAGASASAVNNAGDTCFALAQRYPFKPLIEALAAASGNPGLIRAFTEADVREKVKETKAAIIKRRNLSQNGL